MVNRIISHDTALRLTPTGGDRGRYNIPESPLEDQVAALRKLLVPPSERVANIPQELIPDKPGKTIS